ncbi:MAG: hypothetical protein U1F57_11175 [bacterium]
MTVDVLSRFAETSLASEAGLTGFQSQVDGWVGRFAEEACDWRNLAAMGVGSLFYRLGRMGTLAAGARGGALLAPVVSVASYGVGLASEVTAYETVSGALSPGFRVREGEFWNRWRTSFLQFGLLKWGAAWGGGQNVLLRHALQDTALVTGHQLSARLGWVPAPEGDLAQQFLHAETMNLQLEAGAALFHAAAPGFSALERGLDLSLQASERGIPSAVFSSSFLLPETFAWAGGPSSLEAGSRSFEGGKPYFSMMVEPEGAAAQTVAMSGEAPREARNVFWYPDGSTGRPIATPRYPKALEAELKELQRQLSEGRAVDQNVIERVWRFQFLHFIESAGGTYETFPLERLLQPFAEGESPLSSEALNQALDALRREGASLASPDVIEATFPYENIFFGKGASGPRNTHLLYIFESIQKNLKGQVRLVGQVNGRLILRVTALSFFENLAVAIHGERGPRFEYGWGEMEQGLLMRSKAEGRAPMGMERRALRLGDLNVKVHPWFYTLHDLFHAMGLTQIDLGFRSFVGELFAFVKTRRWSRSPFGKEHLDRLSDLDPPLQGNPIDFFEHSVAAIKEPLQNASGEEKFLTEVLKGHRSLGIYLRELRELAPPSLKERPEYGDFYKTLQKFFEIVDKAVLEITTQYFRALRSRDGGEGE